ncbi:MAG: hypothetical protein IPJ97_00285 [Proteobacteria bacterium]|nr:hypothetical protein [Pseudomonadota bacterium]
MIEVATHVERWELIEPFVTARDANTHVPVLVVQLTGPGGQRGWAEAAGVDYDGETPESMAAQIEDLRGALHDRLTGTELLDLLPAGGARNAIDCALWDLRAKETGSPVWKLAGLPAPHPVTTAFTIGLGDEQGSAAQGAAGPGLSIAETEGRRRTPRRSRPRRAGSTPFRPDHRRREPELDAPVARAIAAATARARRRTGRATRPSWRRCRARWPAQFHSRRGRRVLHRSPFARRVGRPLPKREHQARQVRRAHGSARDVRRGAAPRSRADGGQHVRHVACDGAGLPGGAGLHGHGPGRAVVAATGSVPPDPLRTRRHARAGSRALGLRASIARPRRLQ